MNIDNDNFISSEIINNMMQFFRKAISFSSHKEAGITDMKGEMCYFSGSEFALFNGVFNQCAPEMSKIKEYFSNLKEFFSLKQKPFVWWWMQPEEVHPDIQNELDTQGFNSLGIYSCMAVKLSTVKLKGYSEKITIKKVSTDEEYQIFINIVSQVFKLSPAIKIDFENMLKSYGSGGLFQHYLAYYNDEPATTLTSYMDGKSVGFYCGSTLEEFQKHGICTAVAEYAIAEAIKNSCDLAVTQLMAPGMAKGLCEQIGSREYCRLIPFVKEYRHDEL